jgi:methionine sulfoxide reductase heme-binding subunit
MTDPAPHLFWITSRAAGTTAMLLASATVGMGLLMGAKLAKRAGPDRLRIHQTLSLATMVAIAVHGLALIGDQYLHPSVLDVTVPFLSSYRTLPTSIGIVAGWGMIVLGLSYYVRRWIGYARWKVIHRFTLLVWLGGLVHTFTEGTDAGQLWFIALIVLTAAPALVLLVTRVTRRGPVRAAPSPSGRLLELSGRRSGIAASRSASS